jgi:hypothetical protein
MQDKLYEVILTPEHIEAFHAGVVASERFFREVLRLQDSQDKKTVAWMQANGYVQEDLERAYVQATQVLFQMDKFVLGKELPITADPSYTLVFKEAFEPFEET